MPSGQQHPQLVESQIHDEATAGRLLGPLPPHLACLVQANPIGLIPKPHQPGKWRLIVDLSLPTGASVNDAISPDSCHMPYASILDAAQLIQHLGPGTQKAKLTYRMHTAWYQFTQTLRLSLQKYLTVSYFLAQNTLTRSE